jgi:hypothetical protein
MVVIVGVKLTVTSHMLNGMPVLYLVKETIRLNTEQSTFSAEMQTHINNNISRIQLEAVTS